MRILHFTFALLALSAPGQQGDAAAAEPATLASLPAQVRELLERRHGEMGDAGAPFSQWCQTDPGTYHARLVSIEAEPERIVILFEHGSLAGALKARAEYRLDKGTWTEPGMAPVPAPEAPPVRWTGRTRHFSSPLDTVSPPLTATLTSPLATVTSPLVRRGP
ncbi:hypothetical protein LQ564_19515 [Massilia sp. G4R7]|uniref:Uncharacterized protein n=1 Tax=Massilia phyllostachyos TaxID=2898585 RepID=A0ABS8QCZ6_9BURK|nr:hypothetical protein [Massilia phyllostachyos]MCD2518495.1 hypothetical protein [Massilia phyllostachyos]